MLKIKKNFIPYSKTQCLIFFPSLCFLYGATFDTDDPRVIGIDFNRTHAYQPYTQEDSPTLLPITSDEEKNLFLMHPQVKTLSFPENIRTTPRLEMPGYASSAETALKRLMMKEGRPIDGRHPVHHPEKDPLYRVNAQLMMHFNDGEYGGSGTLVGPHHLITAAHNLYDRKTKAWASKIKVRFSLDGNYLPFEQQNVVRAYTYKHWVNPLEHDSQSFDLALFILDHSIGHETGWHGLCALHRDSLALKGEVSIAGYPAEVSETAFPDQETKHVGEFKKMWWMMNKDHHHTVVPMEISPTRVYYQIDTSGGQSGSGIVWLKEKKQAYVIAVHAYGESAQGRGNYGTRLTPEKLTDLQKWISETYMIGGKFENIPVGIPPADRSASNTSTTGANTTGHSRLKIGGNVKTEGSTGFTKGVVSSEHSQMSIKGNVETRGGSQTVGAELNDEADVTVDGDLVTTSK
jgi:V8-like Glu-specific endopeptidase